MKHSISVPDWIWQYEQQRTGTKNPASALRDRLAKSIVEDKITKEVPIVYDVEFLDDDTPTYIILSRPGICQICRKLMSTGDGAFYYSTNVNDKTLKVTAHPECWEQK